MNLLAPKSVPADDVGLVVRVSDLRQWSYCPRVAFFTRVCVVPKLESYKMQLGRQKEDRLAKLFRRRTLKAFGLDSGELERNVDLHSAELGLVGKLDLLIRRGAQRFPVEVKFTRGPPQLNHRVQLGGYGLLLENLFGVPVPHGYVVRLPEDTVDQIPLDGALRSAVNSLIVAIREMIVSERTPPANPLTACCIDCEYRNFCGDVV